MELINYVVLYIIQTPHMIFNAPISMRQIRCALGLTHFTRIHPGMLSRQVPRQVQYR